MTITKFTFFSPNGNDYPVTANADGKLYQMLSGFDYTTFGRKDWQKSTTAGLTKTFVNTSLVVAGRYFELHNELVTLQASAKNYIHVAIDLSNTANPVTLTVGTSDTSNTIDINNGTGVYKRCIEVVETNAGSVATTTLMPTTHIFESFKTEKATISESNITNLNVSNNVRFSNGFVVNKKGWIDDLQVYSSFISKTIVATETANIGTTLTTKNANVNEKTTTGTFEIKGVQNQRSNQFKTPTVYSTINGTALQEFTLYRNANVVTGNFANIRVDGGIPGGGAIIGWIMDNAFKPEYTQKFSMSTLYGKRMLLSVDPGGAFRNWGDAIPKNDEIYGGVFWICKGTEGGLRG